MSQINSPLLIVYADETRQLVAENLVSHMGIESSHIVEGILRAKDEIGALPAPPNYIAVDIGNRGADIIEELDMLAEVCHPQTKVVITGATNDIGLYRTLIDRGIVEYHPYPSNASELAASLQKDKQSKQGQALPVKKGFAAGFLAAASGDGASTAALNTAYVLANEFNKSVALVDLDYQFGMIARHLDLKAPYGIRELLEYPDRGVDASLLNKMLVPYGNNLHIVAAPQDLRKLPNVRSEQIVELLDVLRSQFDFVLFDIQHVWVDWIASLIGKLDHNVVVSQLWLRSLTHVTRMMAAWTDLGISSQDMSLVINRSGSRFKEGMSADDFQRVSGLHIDCYLPNDTRTMMESEAEGKTIVEIGKSPLASGLRDVAGKLHALHTGEPFEPTSAKKRGLLGMIS